MRVLIEVGHPAHVHTFHYVVQRLLQLDHEVCICAFEKDVTLQLLDVFGLAYHTLGSNKSGGMAAKLRLGVNGVIGMWVIAREFRPDVFLSRVSPVAGLVSRMCRRPHVGFGDTDVPHLANTLGAKVTDVIVTPACFRGDFGKRQVRIQSYKELAYLHPKYFTPDPSVLATEGLSVDTPYSVVRFVSWQAAHDVGQGGFSREGRLRLVRELSRHGRVLVSAEKGIDPELAEYAFRAPPHLMHHFLYYASVCVTEGATMASECAVLGTPAVYMNSLPLGYLKEQQERYGLVFNYHDRRDESMAIAEAVRIASEAASDRQRWRTSAAKLVREHVDVTEFIVQSVADHAAGLRSRVV